MGVPAENNKEYSYKDYLTWPADERWELINGVPYNMSPGPGTEHQVVLRELFKQLAVYLTGKTCQVFVAPFDVRLPLNNEKDDETLTVVQPDILVSWKELKSERY